MELKLSDALRSVHQVREELAMNDLSIRQDKAV
jgi:hypothetical protein